MQEIISSSKNRKRVISVFVKSGPGLDEALNHRLGSRHRHHRRRCEDPDIDLVTPVPHLYINCRLGRDGALDHELLSLYLDRRGGKAY